MGAELLLPPGTRLIHVGPQKTGSTTIQSLMFAARDRLREYGVVYAGEDARPRRAGWAIGLPGGPRERPPLTAWQQLVDQVAAAGDDRVLISDENYARAKSSQIRRIVTELGAGRHHVLLFARRLDTFLPSQWQERVKYGMTASFEEWLERVLGDNPKDWEHWHVWQGHNTAALVERWARVAGSENVTLVIADEQDRTQLTTVFCQLLGLPAEVLGTVKFAGLANPSLSWAEAEVMRQLMALYSAAGHSKHECTLMGKELLAGLRAAPAVAGSPRRAVLPAWAYQRAADLSHQRIEQLQTLPVRIVGSPEQLRIPPLEQRRDPIEAVDASQLVVSTQMAAQAAAGAIRGAQAAAHFVATVRNPALKPVQEASGRELLAELMRRLRARKRPNPALKP